MQPIFKVFDMATKNCLIKVSKLQDGINHLQFSLDTNFFVSNGSNLINDCLLVSDIEIDKHEQTSTIKFYIKGAVELDCDICNKQIRVPLDIEGGAIVKIEEQSQKELDEIEEIIYIRKYDDNIYIDELLYDSVIVSIPMKKSCEIEGVEKNCDKELLNRLENLNQNIDEGPDDRWDDLRNIKFDN